MKNFLSLFLVILLLTITGASCATQDTTQDETIDYFTINLSHQPAARAVPTQIAINEGWDKQAGLNAVFKYYGVGPVQIEALTAREWDAGLSGALPTLTAVLRHSTYVVAIGNDEAPCNQLWASPDSDIFDSKGYNPEYLDVYGSPESIRGKTLGFPFGTGAHQSILAWLDIIGVSKDEVTLVNMDAWASLVALEAEQIDVAAFWHPVGFAAQDKGMFQIATSDELGAPQFAGWIATRELVENNPEKLARWLVVWEKALEYSLDNIDFAAQFYHEYLMDNGIELGLEHSAEEFRIRRWYTLEEQLEMFRSGEIEAGMLKLVEFLEEEGRITEVEKNNLIEKRYGLTEDILIMAIEMKSQM